MAVEELATELGPNLRTARHGVPDVRWTQCSANGRTGGADKALRPEPPQALRARQQPHVVGALRPREESTAAEEWADRSRDLPPHHHRDEPA